ncbi:MAG: UpxY family transcription antiterminator [Ignavibacteriales bacterium]|nr:MAG: UpxY family transcription antiterminator [Ignavibacteriales bacterium]
MDEEKQCLCNDMNRCWFAFYTKPRHEFKVAENLAGISIVHYLPVVTRLKQWSDRKKKVIEPLIRGYIFAFVNSKERLIALQQDSIINCVCFNGKPASIPEWQIENLQRMLKNESNFMISDVVKAGSKIKVLEGPFAGVEGIVKYTSEGRTISITIDLLKRSITAVLPKESVIQIM